MFRSLVVLCLSCLPIAAHALDRGTAATRFREAHRAVSAHISADGFLLDSSPAAATALDAQWAAARDLVAALLDRQPELAPAALTRQAKHSAGLGVYALRLDPDAVLVDTESGEFGTAFLFRRGDDGHYHSVFALHETAAARAGPTAALAAWRSVNAASICRSRPSEGEWYRCGPMAVQRLIPLQAEAAGGRRFAILGSYVVPMGGTVPFQLTIWRWDGRSATLLLARTLSQTLTQPVFVGEDARGFTLRVKEQHQSFSASEEGGGRQMIWRFDLPATGAAAPRIRAIARTRSCGSPLRPVGRTSADGRSRRAVRGRAPTQRGGQHAELMALFGAGQGHNEDLCGYDQLRPASDIPDCPAGWKAMDRRCRLRSPARLRRPRGALLDCAGGQGWPVHARASV